MKKCVFCQIVQGKKTCFKIYEDKDYLVFLDTNPFVPGHTLVIPKKHYRWVWEVPNLGHFFEVAGKIAAHYQRITGDQFVTSLVWGIKVPHAHIQILPQPHQLDLPWPRGKLTQEEGNQLQKKLALKH